ncbi:MAG TPA: hypothetical protein HA360_05740 [Nanoarchaeota archaeon]|nr:hypothetical protein [Candidatus Woesearchaeota archaeon]HIH15431.1 hypothetical protein [Nanoarchaeota archaeon]HIH58943.1 hypothetical protein [Nanoarchaeota archaeon]HII14546.1 hypothetical protein [Nanoarchaeota archaeon]HIJ04493.1 hypothetical protein [Nanoarchaeota archaeon]
MKHGTILEGAIEWDTLVKIGGTPSLATRIIATAGRDSVALHKDLLDCYTEGVEAWQEWCAQYPTSAFTHEPARFFPGSFGDKGCLVIEQYLLAKGLICETPCRNVLEDRALFRISFGPEYGHPRALFKYLTEEPRLGYVKPSVDRIKALRHFTYSAKDATVEQFVPKE